MTKSNSKNRIPTHPGEMLQEEFLKPMKITQMELAKSINVSFQRINELVNEKRGITPSTALRLARFFGNSPQFWMNLQNAWDLQKTELKEESILNQIDCVTC